MLVVDIRGGEGEGEGQHASDVHHQVDRVCSISSILLGNQSDYRRWNTLFKLISWCVHCQQFLNLRERGGGGEGEEGGGGSEG